MIVLQIAVVLSTLAPTECSLVGGALSAPAPGVALVLATSTGRELSVPVPLDVRHQRIPVDSVLAPEFVVRDVTRPDPMRDAWGILMPSDTFAAVPWDYDTDCGPMLWSRDEWVPPGANVIFRVRGARRFAGRRVLDVLGVLEPYPYGRHGTPPEAPEDPDDWLPAHDVFRLLTQMPTPFGRGTPLEQLKRFEDAYRSGPTTLLEKYPGPGLLERAREWVRMSGAR